MVALLLRRSALCLITLTFACSIGTANTSLHAETPTSEPESIFPDPALEAAVRASVFAKRTNDEPLTPEDVAEISRVVAPGKEIRSLAGLQHCGSLMLLDFTGNEISDLTPLAGLKKLQSVTLAENRIEDISPLAGLTAIQLLDLSLNKVENLDPIAKMTNMRALYLADNRIDGITAIANLKKIGALDIAGNAIVDLSPVSGLTSLTTLEFSDCQVQSLLPLVSLPNLSMLIMPNNPIDSLDPIVKMCVEDASSNRRFAPYLKLYLDLRSDKAAAWQEAIQKLKDVGVSVRDYRRHTSSKTTHTP